MLAEEWDNTGLQTGSRASDTSAVLLALNVNEQVIREAVTNGCGLILTHHPLIFSPLDSVSDDTKAGRLVQLANRNDLSILAAHTNLDAARGGLADILAGLLGLVKTAPLEGALTAWSKLVTFVPPADLDRVREALFDAGAGVIGDYQHCSWFVEGTGTFLPMEGARPSIGEVGRDERVEELRLEMVFPSAKAGEMAAALAGSHSYEEPAYDIYPMVTRSHNTGSGRTGELETPKQLGEFSSHVAECFQMDEARFTGDPMRTVSRIAVVPGSGARYIGACASRADVLVTGDYSYHDLVLADELGLALIEVPHDVSEARALSLWAPRFEQELSPAGVKLVLSAAGTGYWRSAKGETAEKANKGGKSSKTEEKGEPLHHLHVDGGSRGNPGPAGIGAVLQDGNGATVATLSEFIGKATNNVAEYSALIAGVEMALARGVRKLAIFSDSELIVRQLQGSYRVKNEGLRSYYEQAKSLLGRLDEFELTSVPRESNDHADELVNRALDKAGH